MAFGSFGLALVFALGAGAHRRLDAVTITRWAPGAVTGVTGEGASPLFGADRRLTLIECATPGVWCVSLIKSLNTTPLIPPSATRFKSNPILYAKRCAEVLDGDLCDALNSENSLSAVEICVIRDLPFEYIPLHSCGVDKISLNL